MLRPIFLALFTLLLTACATSHVLTGQPRPPIDPSQVQVYFSPPPGTYEEIALLDTASGPFTYGEQNKTNAVIENLRVEAAKLGANGVLFQGTADGYGGSSIGVGAGGGSFGNSSFRSGGIGVSVSPTKKHARGIAIHVVNPPPPQAAPPIN